MGDLRGAEQCFRRVIEIEPENSFGHYLLGGLLMIMGLGHLDGAEMSVTRAIEINPEDDDYHSLLRCLLKAIDIRDEPSDGE